MAGFQTVPDYRCSGNLRHEERDCNRKPCYESTTTGFLTTGTSTESSTNGHGHYSQPSKPNKPSKPEPTYENKKCSWKPGMRPDCKNARCSLRFSNDCFDQIYRNVKSDLCNSRKSQEIMQKIGHYLTPIGYTMETKWGARENNIKLETMQLFKTRHDSKITKNKLKNLQLGRLILYDFRSLK